MWANIKTGLLFTSTSRMNPVIPIQETSYANKGRSAYSEARTLPVGYSAQTVLKSRLYFVCTKETKVQELHPYCGREIEPKMTSLYV